MRSRLAVMHFTCASAAVLWLGAPAGGLAQTVAGSGLADTCLQLSYTNPDDQTVGEILPEFVLLHAGVEAGAVSSGSRPSQASAFWTMMLLGGSWSRAADSLHLAFTNGFSGVAYHLHLPDGESGTGTVTFYWDFPTDDISPTSATARSVPCSEAWIQSPPGEAERWERDRRRSAILKAERQRVQSLESPLVGTYALKLALASGDTLNLFARTERAPTYVVWDMSGPASGTEPENLTATTHSEGYQLALWVAEELDDLSPTADPDRRERAWFTVAQTPAVENVDSTVWLGRLDAVFAASRLIDEEPWDSALSESSRMVNDLWYQSLSPDSVIEGETIGRFVADAEGSMHVSLIVKRGGTTVHTVEGIRISLAALSGSELRP